MGISNILDIGRTRSVLMRSNKMKLGYKWWVGSSILIGAVSIGVVASLAGQVRAAPELPKGDPTAVAKCESIMPIASGYGTITAVLRGETSTAAAVVQWQEHRGRLGIVSPFRSLAARTTVTVCLLTGEFVTPVGPPDLTGRQKTPHNVIRLLVLSSNEILLDSAGYRGGMAPETPTDLAVVR
jgi:hypothetical protein